MVRKNRRFILPIEDREPVYQWDYVPPEEPPEPVESLPNPSILESTAPVGIVEAGVSQQEITTLKPGDAVPYVFGTTIVTPGIITVVKRSVGNIYFDLLLSTGECDFVSAIIQGGETFDTNFGNSPLVLPLPGWEFHSGATGQAASPGIVAELGAYDTLDGICHVVARVNQYTSMDIKFILKGLKLFDPRPSPQTTEYSNNPALALARIFVDSGYTMDWDSVAEAANYCDENVGGSPFAARWTLNLAAFARQPLDRWAHTLAQYCGGLHIDTNRAGIVYLVADKKVTSSPQITHTITADDIERPRTSRAGINNVPLKAVVHYREADGTTGSATVGTGSGGEVSRLQMPGFDTYTMAARFGTETLAKAAADKVHEHIAYDKSLSPTIGELADITYAPHGLSSERMRLIDYRQLEIGRWWRRYKEYSDDSYSDGIFTQPTVGTGTGLDDPYDVPVGPTPTMTLETYAAGGYDRYKITFTGTSWLYAREYRVNVAGTQVVLETVTPHLGIVTHTVYTSAVTAGEEYTASVYIRSESGQMGAAGTATATPPGALLTTTAKHFGDGSSPSNYYETGGGSSVSPQDWNALIPASGSSDPYQKMTLVFCIYPVALGDGDSWYIFDSVSGNFRVGNNDVTGGIWIGCRSENNLTKNENSTPTGSPSDYGGLIPGQWNQVMISFDGDNSSSPQTRNVEIWANGVEVFNGSWGTVLGDGGNNPMSWAGKCWVGLGYDEDGMDCYLSYVWCKEEYLDPNTYWDSFFNGSGKPYNIGTDGSSVTGSQPETYCPDADFTDNKGSGDNWTEVGTVPAAPSSPSD